jgi:hypothetical protein
MPTMLSAPNYPDHSSKSGCQRLCDIIMEVWARRGSAVSAWPELNAHGGYIVKSNLLNGLPQ